MKVLTYTPMRISSSQIPVERFTPVAQSSLYVRQTAAWALKQQIRNLKIVETGGYCWKQSHVCLLSDRSKSALSACILYNSVSFLNDWKLATILSFFWMYNLFQNKKERNWPSRNIEIAENHLMLLLFFIALQNGRKSLFPFLIAFTFQRKTLPFTNLVVEVLAVQLCYQLLGC